MVMCVLHVVTHCWGMRVDAHDSEKHPSSARGVLTALHRRSKLKNCQRQKRYRSCKEQKEYQNPELAMADRFQGIENQSAGCSETNRRSEERPCPETEKCNLHRDENLSQGAALARRVVSSPRADRGDVCKIHS